MRIGVMLRHVGEHGGGVNVYTRRVLTEMLRIPSGHEFVFFYRQPEQAGQFGAPANLREVVVGAPAKLAGTRSRCRSPRVERKSMYSLNLNTRCPWSAASPASGCCTASITCAR